MGILKWPPPCFPQGQEASRGLSSCSLTWDLSPPSPSRMVPVMGGFLPPCILSLKPFILLLGPASPRASSSALPERPQEGHSCPPCASWSQSFPALALVWTSRAVSELPCSLQ